MKTSGIYDPPSANTTIIWLAGPWISWRLSIPFLPNGDTEHWGNETVQEVITDVAFQNEKSFQATEITSNIRSRAFISYHFIP